MSRSKGLWIRFGSSTSIDRHVRVAEIAGIPSAEARGKAIEIPGRDGTLWLSDGAYKDISVKVDMEVAAAYYDAAAVWLSGSGNLILSPFSTYGYNANTGALEISTPTYYYEARIVKGFEMKRGIFVNGCYRATVEFTCKPFRKLLNEPTITLTQPTASTNGNGNRTARPVITVNGSGNINLLVNGASVLMTGVNQSITIDCDAMMAYKGDDNLSPQVTIMPHADTGEEVWPTLNPGTNAVNWSVSAADTGSTQQEAAASSVTSVVIQPNWRWR